MNPVAVKLAVMFIDQMTVWTAAWMQAKNNPNMTEAEAEQLISDTQRKAKETSDNWRKLRQG